MWGIPSIKLEVGLLLSGLGEMCWFVDFVEGVEVEGLDPGTNGEISPHVHILEGKVGRVPGEVESTIESGDRIHELETAAISAD